uniref:Putative enoyl-CoA delta isomerase 1, peroxisomal-like n=1 Tax=Davidia involucrata TaxID=16924 RepID=A0A5B6YN19_DAVIN
MINSQFGIMGRRKNLQALNQADHHRGYRSSAGGQTPAPNSSSSPSTPPLSPSLVLSLIPAMGPISPSQTTYSPVPSSTPALSSDQSPSPSPTPASAPDHAAVTPSLGILHHTVIQNPRLLLDFLFRPHLQVLLVIWMQEGVTQWVHISEFRKVCLLRPVPYLLQFLVLVHSFSFSLCVHLEINQQLKIGFDNLGFEMDSDKEGSGSDVTGGDLLKKKIGVC